MLKNPSRRVPLPSLMSNDTTCYEWLLEKRLIGLKPFMVVSDSMFARHEENQWLLQRMEYVFSDKQKVSTYSTEIEREELRFAQYEKEREIVKLNEEAEKRSAPTSDLIRLEYDMSGMMFNPDLPVIVSSQENDTVLVVCGRREQKFYIMTKEMNDMNQIIMDEELYKLHPVYSFLDVNLPDINQLILLDGSRWRLILQYADGTIITSGGSIPSDRNLGKLEKYIFDHVLPGRNLQE